MRTLEGRVAVVTGAGYGMGKAHAEALARLGSLVVVNDIDGDAAARVAEAIISDGGVAQAVEADVSDRAAVERMVSAAVERFGGIDIVVSNAGLIHAATGLESTHDDEWVRSFAVHVGGALNLTRAALPMLKASKAGRVIIVSSMWAQTPPGHSYGYVSAKGALLAFSRNLAIELAPYGICVNALTPGEINTRMNADKSQADKHRDAQQIPLGRWAEPEEVSGLVAFLASDDSAFITGQTIAINGGQVIAGS